jgi:hypothetical protein
VARQVQVQILDDIDGSAADETLQFGLDSTTYEIDLNAKHAKQLRSELGTFVAAARRLGRGGITRSVQHRSATPTRSDRAQNQAIRDWAKRKKIKLSDRGRIPANVIEQYEAEAGR